MLEVIRRVPLIFVASASLGVFAGAQQPATSYAAKAADANQSITVKELESTITAIRGKSDRDVAREIGRMQLSERLTLGRLEKLSAMLPGKRSTEALMAVADASSFQSLPESEQLKIMAPDRTTQGQIVSRATDFVAHTVSTMPDFIATKTTIRFQEVAHLRVKEEPVIVLHSGFQLIDRSEVTTVYRDGKEVEETSKKRPERNVSNVKGLSTWGIFGPLLAIVMTDVLKGKIGWSHWEQSAGRPAAVFVFSVPQEASTYNVRYCCIRGDKGFRVPFEATPAYHGEIAIDPQTGAIVRIVLRTDLRSGIELRRMDLAVDYAPVTIGGRSYICPLKSVSIANEVELLKKAVQTANGTRVYKLVDGPTVTAINDISFGDYHQFRSEIKILPYEGSTPPAQ